MAICEECGKEYDVEYDSEEFTCSVGMELEGMHFDKHLCCECAEQAIESGEYYDESEKCGKRFYVEEANEAFDNECPDYHLVGSSRSDFCELILCGDCAVEQLRQWYYGMKEQGAFDEKSDERISVYDAALIWASNGKDEDYTFGYTEEELEEQL